MQASSRCIFTRAHAHLHARAHTPRRFRHRACAIPQERTFRHRHEHARTMIGMCQKITKAPSGRDVAQACTHAHMHTCASHAHMQTCTLAHMHTCVHILSHQHLVSSDLCTIFRCVLICHTYTRMNQLNQKSHGANGTRVYERWCKHLESKESKIRTIIMCSCLLLLIHTRVRTTGQNTTFVVRT